MPTVGNTPKVCPRKLPPKNDNKTASNAMTMSDGQKYSLCSTGQCYGRFGKKSTHLPCAWATLVPMHIDVLTLFPGMLATCCPG